MATTYIRGVPGIIEAINARRSHVDQDVQRLVVDRVGSADRHPRQAETHARGELAALTDLLSYLQGATVLSEEDFDNRFKIGGFGSPGEASYAVTLS